MPAKKSNKPKKSSVKKGTKKTPAKKKPTRKLAAKAKALKKQEKSPFATVAFFAYVEFMAKPDPERCEMLGIPYEEKTRKYIAKPTSGAFAKKYDVHINTLTNWKQRKDFNVAVHQKRNFWGLEKVPNVMAALYQRCLRYGMAHDVELFLAYYEKWDRKAAVANAPVPFTADDIRLIIDVLPEDRQEHFHGIITAAITEAQSLGGGNS